VRHMPDIQETHLPGVGIRHDFETESGARIGMITHRTGHRELLIYDRDDPDACRQAVRLEEEDARRLAEMLGGSRVTEGLARLQQSIEGMTIDWVPVRRTSGCAGHRLRDVGIAAEGSATIVAILRAGETIPSPSLEFELHEGDTAVVVGTPEGIERLLSLLG
jgi:TrkA domain protein